MNTLYSNKDLKAWFACKQEAKLRRVLRARKIKFELDGNNKAISKDDWINGSVKKEESDEVSF